MSLDVGIKALDRFFDILKPIARKSPRRKAAVTFFGGEPLLMPLLLKQLVDYATKHAPMPIVFNITTNGSLLTDDIVDFFVSHGVFIAVSLDGRKVDHNRNRKFPNGSGTFDVVFENIKRLQERYPEYDRLGTICLYDWTTDLEANIPFWEENPRLKILFLNPPSAINTRYYERFSQEDQQRFAEQIGRLSNQYYELKKSGKPVPKYLRALCEPDLGVVVLRPRRDDLRPAMLPYTGTCIPGMKLSVRADGTFDMCERVNAMFPIGDVARGLDFGAIKNTISLYNAAITRNCPSCLFSKNCPMCFSQCNRDCSFSLPEGWCRGFGESFKRALINVYSILETQPSAFDEYYGPRDSGEFLFRF
jgi:uncharacterized protein